MDALGNPTRRALVDLLRKGPRTVNDLTAAVPVSQPAVSQHLRVLREAGLVTRDREGARRIYQMSPDGLRVLRRYVESYWEETLEAFRKSTITPRREQRT